jgi:hypothetical protein
VCHLNHTAGERKIISVDNLAELSFKRKDFEETLFGEASGEKLLRIQLWPTR